MLTNTLVQSQELTYRISFPEAVRHYAQISIDVPVKKNEEVVFKMPVWTPGSYKVREFSQHVDRASYTMLNDAGQPGTVVEVRRKDKNTWTCKGENTGVLRFTYNVYAFELGVRTSYVDQHMAFLHGPSAFIYVEGKEELPIRLQFNPLNDWLKVEMALPKGKSPNSFECANYDLLADSPVALGNFDVSTYETAGVPHSIVMIGEGNYDIERVTRDFKTITDKETEMFNGEHPCERYIHFIQNVESGGGGLEHLNCHTSQIQRWAYSNEEKYLSFLGLISHEYFHLWNVKRIRGIKLGPFNYNEENYSDLLWVAEGITSYYDDLFLMRAGIHSEETYFKALEGNINRLQNQPGRHVMSLPEASRLAWVKAYMPNENSKNVTISYYNKGMLVAWMLDMHLLEVTKGKKRLDDVMRKLYKDFYQKKDRGFTQDEFIGTCEKVAGESLTEFFNAYVFGKVEIPYNDFLKTVGISIEDKADKEPSLGMSTKSENGKTVVSYVQPDGAAVKAGLSVHDEIIALGGWRVGADLSSELERIDVNTAIEIIYSRSGKIGRAVLIPETSTSVKFAITPAESKSKQQSDLYKIWLD
jgi:predicted metalloprotease with PDZ domain